jgi:hypothetical protein
MMESAMSETPKDEFEVEIVDDTPEEDRRKRRAAEPEAKSEPAAVDEDDLSQYSASVQKRISKLVYDRNEERRQREEAARLREEAIRYAEAVRSENERLKQRLTEGQTSAMVESKARLDAELANQKAAFKSAYEAGDAEAVSEAQIKIAELTSRKAQLETTAAQQEMWAKQQAERARQVQQAPQPVRPQPARIPEPDGMAKDWAARNGWFGKDEEMTGYAFGVHERLVRGGVDPRTKTYYDRIDEAVRTRFPEKFDTPGEDVPVQPRNTGNVVAPTSRDVKAPRTVRLSTSAVALAKRLGLTPEQYAAQLLKERQNG